MSESSYGILLPSYWDGPTGQALQARGKDAVILGAFLTANPFANMIGLYELSFAKLERALPVIKGRKSLRQAIESLAEEGFAYYDFRSEFAWVREMARVRLRLSGTPMPELDKRRLGAVRLYETVPFNPFLGLFYERYRIELRLTRRRGEERRAEGASQGASEGASEGASPAAYLVRTDVRTGDQYDQHQVSGSALSAAAAPPGESAAAQTPRHTHDPNPKTADENVEVITALVLKDILPLNLPDTELMEATKSRCATLHIEYDSFAVRRAIDSAQFRRHLQNPLFDPPSGVPPVKRHG